MIWPQKACFVYKHDMAKQFNVNYDFNQHLEQPTGNDQEDEYVDCEALQFT